MFCTCSLLYVPTTRQHVFVADGDRLVAVALGSLHGR